MTQEYGLRFKVDSRDVKKAQADVDSLGRKAGDTERQVTGGNDRMSRSFGNLAAKVSSLSIVMGLLGGASLGAVIRQAAEFEATMSSVQAVTRATNDEMKNLSATARQLGATTMFSASQAAEGMKFLGMAGFNTRQIMAAMPATLSLAAAGGLGLAQAADIASNSLSGFGIAAEQMGRVSDVLAAAASRSNTSVAQLGDALSYAAPSARTLGVSIEETVAAVGALSDAGIQSSRAGTGLAGVFRQLTNITTEGEKVLKAYGLSVQDVDIKSNGLGKVLSTVASKNLSAGDAIKLFGAEAGVAAQVLLAATGRVDELTVALNGAEGEAKRMAGTMVDNLTGDVTKASSALGELALKVNDASGVKDGLRVVVQALTKALTENDTELAKVIASLGYAIGSLAALTTLIWGANAATIAWNAALRLNPIIMAGTLFVGALAGITKYNNETERAKDVTQRLAEAESRLADAKSRVQMAQRSPSLMRPAQEELRRSTEAVKALREEIKVKDEEIKQGLDKIVVEVLAEEAARNAAEAVANLAAEESKRIRLTEDQIKAQKKAAEEYARSQQIISDAIESVTDKIAKFNMNDSEVMMFDFDKLSPTPEQTARMAGYVEQFALLKQAEDNAKFAMDQYEESVKKADQAVADFLSRDFGVDLSVGFDKASQSLGTLVTLMEKFSTASKAADEARMSAQLKLEAGKVTQIQFEKELSKINSKATREQIGGFAALAGAAKGLLSERSKGHRIMEKAEKGLRIAQIAHAIWEKKEEAIKLAIKLKGYAIDLGTFLASIPLKIAGFLGVGAAAGAAATAAAAIQPGPAAFVGFAAMAALIASIGLGGKGSKGSAPDPGNTGIGTVFGDKDAKSESIANSIEQLEKSAGIGNRISSQMLNSLRNIEANIGGLTNLIVRQNPEVGGKLASGIKTGSELSSTAQGVLKFGSAATLIGAGVTAGAFLGGAAFLNAIGPLVYAALGPVGLVIGALTTFVPAIGKAISSITGAIFGKTKTKITGQGLFGDAQSLGDILLGGFDLQEYIDVQIKKKSLFKSSTKNRTQFGSADEELANQFTLIFAGFAESILAASGPIGLNLDDVTQRLMDFEVNIGKINLKGLKAEEIQEKLEAVFGQQADLIARAAIGGLDAFQQVGEGYFETVVRVASGIEVANSALDQMGVTAINYTQILRTQGDVAVEIIRQSVVMADTSRDVSGGFAQIVDAFDGTAEDIIDLITTLRDLQSQLRSVGRDADMLTVAMINGAGGVDGLSSGLDALFDMLDPAEQLAAKTAELTREFNRIGQILPTSIADYRALANGIDISTEAGQKLFGQVVALAPAFKGLADLIDDEMQRTIGELERSITEAFREMRQAVQQAENDLRAAYQRQARDIQQVISQFSQLADTLSAFRKEIGRAVGETQQGGLSSARSEFASIGNRAMLGDQDAMRLLPEVGRRLEQASAGFAASREEYVRDLANLQRAAASAEAVAGRQKSIAEQQLDALNFAVAKLIDIEVGQVTAAGFRAALEGVGVTDPAIVDAVDTNRDGIITSQEAAAARQVIEDHRAQGLLDLVAGNTQSVEQATLTLRELQSLENLAIIRATEAGFGNLAGLQDRLVGALEAGNTASAKINSAINQLVAIAARDEADRVAAQQAQEAAIEAERVAQLERERVSQIAQLQQAGMSSAQTVIQARDAVQGAFEQLAQVALRTPTTKTEIVSTSGQRARTDAQAAAAGIFNKDELGGAASTFSFINDFGQQKFNALWRDQLNQFNSLGQNATQIIQGGLNATIQTEFERANALRQQIIDLGGVPGFATGGMHAGGWRVVGEHGPELEYTGPSRIFNANQSSSMMDHSGVEQRLERLEQTMMRGFHAVEKNTGRTAEQLRRWEGDGLPPEREVAA